MKIDRIKLSAVAASTVLALTFAGCGRDTRSNPEMDNTTTTESTMTPTTTGSAAGTTDTTGTSTTGATSGATDPSQTPPPPGN